MHMNIHVTGGAGYIGIHTCVALLHAGHAVTVIDHWATAAPRWSISYRCWTDGRFLEPQHVGYI